MISSVSVIVIDCQYHSRITGSRSQAPPPFGEKNKLPMLLHISSFRSQFGVLFSVLILFRILDTVVVFQINIDPNFRIWFSVAQEAHSLDMCTKSKHIPTKYKYHPFCTTSMQNITFYIHAITFHNSLHSLLIMNIYLKSINPILKINPTLLHFVFHHIHQ